MPLWLLQRKHASARFAALVGTAVLPGDDVIHLKA
jgi:hypothetical protein